MLKPCLTSSCVTSTSCLSYLRAEHHEALTPDLHLRDVSHLTFKSEWQFDDYNGYGSVTLSIDGPDGKSLFDLLDELSVDEHGHPPHMDSGTGQCDINAIDYMLNTLGLNMQRSVFMEIVSTCMEILLDNRLKQRGNAVIPGASLSDLVFKVTGSIDEDLEENQMP